METQITKTCTKCGEAKDLECFHKKSRSKDGLRPDCKDCVNAFQARQRKANPEKHRASSAAWAKNNKEKRRAWENANREKTRARASAWAKANPEKARAKSKKWESENQDRVKSRDSYVAKVLGLPVKLITAELLAAKREQLEIHRLTAELQRELKELTK